VERGGQNYAVVVTEEKYRHIPILIPAVRSQILDLAFDVLLKERKAASGFLGRMQCLEGKSVLLINGGTNMSDEISVFLESKGARVAVYGKHFQKAGKRPSFTQKKAGNISFYSGGKDGFITEEVLAQIINEFGAIDIVIHDLGTDDFQANRKNTNKRRGEGLEANLRCAWNLAGMIEKQITNGMQGKFIYIAPWAWDRLADPHRYETVKAGSVALTRFMAKNLAPYRANVNCIVPGFILPSFFSKLNKEKADELSEEIPFGRLGEIADITETVLFLARNESKYLSGQILEVTGGLT
jgi:3-oxoacyl-[acyl-carrier protein] reductase